MIRSLAAFGLLAAFAVAALAQGIGPAPFRPPPSALIPCEGAPKDAVTRLPPEIGRWAIVHCTRRGHIFSFNDTHFGSTLATGVPLIVNAAEFTDRRGAAGHDAYFSEISLSPVSEAERQDLLAKNRDLLAPHAKQPWSYLSLSVQSGRVLRFVAVDPAAESFWLFPVGEGRVLPPFFVTSLAKLNQKN